MRSIIRIYFRLRLIGFIFLFACVAYLNFPTAAYAQISTPRFAHLTSEHGLSHNMVRCILQDNQGFMWFGTQDGLNKYDGYSFTVYRHLRSDPDSLSNSTITALYQDRTGILWVGTAMGLDRFTGGAGGFLHYPNVSEEVNVIYEDTTGALWIGTASAGLFRYDRDTEAFIQYLHDPVDSDSLSDDEVLSIFEDRSGILWVGTAYGGLNAYDGAIGTFTRYRHDSADPHSLSHDRVNAIFEDRFGILWVGTGNDYEVEVGGLNAFDQASQQFTHYLHDPQDRGSLSNNNIRSIFEDQTGTLWIGTDDGLNVFDHRTSTFASYHPDPLTPDALGGGVITAIYEDRAGALWIGTDGNGINRYARVKEKLARYQPDLFAVSGLSGPVISALYEDHTGMLWIGVAGEGLDRLDRATGQYTHYAYNPDDPYSLSNNNVRAIYEDHQGELWVGTSLGLDRLEIASGRFTHYFHDPDDLASLAPGAVKAILEDHAHHLWIATEEPGSINRFDRITETFFRYEYNPDNPESFINTYGVRAIYEDRAGDLWLGTYDGLVHFDREEEQFTQYEHDPDDPNSLSSDFVWSIYEDPAGILWIATSAGLNRFNRATGQFAVYTMEDGLVNDSVMCVLADEQENLWLGTDAGLAVFNPQAETFRHYDVSDGLASNVILLGSCHKSRSGEMFFGSLEGFNAFYPASVHENPHIPPIVLTAFRKFDRVVEFDSPLAEVQEITLSYRDNFFAFEFAALDFTDSSKNQYAYRLQGFDQDWIYCGTRRYASYTNLSPGDYIFRVKGTNNDGVWNETGLAVRVTITPPFWETGWFKALAAAFVLSTIGVVVKSRMKRIAELRESEERLRALFENAPLCVFELDLTPDPPGIIRANHRSERVYGWSAMEFAALRLDKLFPSTAWSALVRMIDALSAGQTITVESVGLRRNGSEFPIRISATGLSRDGIGRLEGETRADLKRAILTVEDITAESERRTEEEAIAEERRRIAREIHDGLAQDLTGLRFKVGLWHDLVDNDRAQMHAELNDFQELLRKNIREVRRAIFALRPVALDELGFYPALREFSRDFGEQNQLHLDLNIQGSTERLPGPLEPVLFRIVQESLNNVGKHAQATNVWIRLDLTLSDKVTLHVRDDGIGFDPAELDHMVARGHLGLKQMRERVEQLNGNFEVRSQPGDGTEIRAVLPLGEVA